MSSFTAKYEMDPEKTKSGIKVLLSKDMWVRVLRANNPLAIAMRRQRERAYNGNVPDDVLEEILTETLAKTIVKDWGGILDDEGNEVPFSVDKALEYFTKYPDFRDDVFSAAVNRDAFAVGNREGAVKN